MCGDFRAPRHLQVAQPPLSAELTYNSRYRIKDAGPRNREKNDVLLERFGIRLNTFFGIQTFVSKGTNFFRFLKSTESYP